MFTFSCPARHILVGLAIILLAACSSGGGDGGTVYNHHSTGNVSIDRPSLEDDILSVAYTLTVLPMGSEMNITFDTGYRPEGKDEIIAIWGTSGDSKHSSNYEIVYNPSDKKGES